jgi:tricorn protease
MDSAPLGQLTTNGTVFRYEGLPSPDSNWLAYGDKNQRLWLHHLEKRETRLVAESGVESLTDFAWSPDSQWLAYAEPATNSYHQIKLFRPADNTRVTVTSDRVDGYEPAWSPGGKWLYLPGARELGPFRRRPGDRSSEPFFVKPRRFIKSP